MDYDQNKVGKNQKEKLAGDGQLEHSLLEQIDDMDARGGFLGEDQQKIGEIGEQILDLSGEQQIEKEEGVESKKAVNLQMPPGMAEEKIEEKSSVEEGPFERLSVASEQALQKEGVKQVKRVIEDFSDNDNPNEFYKVARRTNMSYIEKLRGKVEGKKQ